MLNQQTITWYSSQSANTLEGLIKGLIRENFVVDSVVITEYRKLPGDFVSEAVKALIVYSSKP